MRTGSIPAGAGKPSACAAEVLEGDAGLSPRARGSRVCVVVREVRPGSIPAGAGKPRCDPPIGGWCEVYPRGRGEALCQAIRVEDFSAQGLSPRARGSPATVLQAGCRLASGSIPAGAGKPTTQWLARPVTWRWVYPRGRGEAFWKASSRVRAWGLSPRARGSPWAGAADALRPGSIPAGAGKPRSCSPTGMMRWVYPRGRGEAHVSVRLRRLQGLSPRARGSPL